MCRFRPERFKNDYQLRQQRQGGTQSNEHGQPRQQTEIYAGNKIGQDQNQKTADNRQRCVIHGAANAAVALMNCLYIAMFELELVFEAVNIVNRIIDRYADADGCNGNGHHIKGNIQPPHNSEHH